MTWLSVVCAVSLADNQLCGIDCNDEGTYTAEGIIKLCEALKESGVTSLRSATSSRARFFVSAR